MFRDNYKVYRTKDPKDTVFFLSRLIHKVVNDKNNLVDLTSNLLRKNTGRTPKKDYSELIKLSKKSQMTPGVFNKTVLLQIPEYHQIL